MTMQGAVRTFMGRRERDDRTTVLVVGGMHSAGCVSRVQGALLGRPGVETAGVNLLTRMATVRHAMDVRPGELLEAISTAGYQATLASPGPDIRAHMSFGDTINVIASRRSRFIAGAVFTFLILTVKYAGTSENRLTTMLMFLLATPVQVTVGWDYYRAFFHALKKGSFNLDSLVVLGASAAYLQGFLCFLGHVTADSSLMQWQPQFHTAAVILTVVSLGKWLESRARESTTPLWGNLSALMPREACVLRDGREQVIPSGVVALGDTVLVGPNERIPVDGEVIDGASEVNETLITGEARPVRKGRGDRVIVASMNGSGKLRIRATGVGADSTLAQIARMVTEAQARKGRVEQMADRIAAILVPLTVILSIAAFVVWYFGPIAIKTVEASGWLSPDWLAWLRAGSFAFLFRESSVPEALVPAIAVLVVSCPCALGLATPMAVVVAAGLAARRGIVFRGGEGMEAAARVNDVIFSKISTLTEGTFSMREVIPAPGVSKEELLTIAASLEAGSEHALAKGVVNEARRNTLTLRKVHDLEPVPSRGIKGTIRDRNYLLGSHALIQECGFSLSDEFGQRVAAAERDGCTLIFLAEEMASAVRDSRDQNCPGRILGAIALADRVKESTEPGIHELRKAGFNVHLLSGRSASEAAYLGRTCGFEANEIHAEMRAENKVEFMQELKARSGGAGGVGDGIDDLPVLASADAGIALGSGTDTALESAQVMLMSGDVRNVARALKLARRASSIIHWNLFWAFVFNAVLIPLAFINRLDPTLGAGLMAFSSIVIVLNSLRLSYVKLD